MKTQFTRIGIGLASVLASLGHTVDSSAAGWIPYSGPNMSQVAVAKGIMFGVASSQPSTFGQAMHAYVPTGTTGFNNVDACIEPAFTGNTIFTGTNRVMAVAATDHYIGAVSTVPAGYFEVWVEGTDGSVYKTHGNSSCAVSPNSSNVPGPWQLVITPNLTGTNSHVYLREIAPTWDANGGLLYTVDAFNRLYKNNWAGGGWNPPINPTTSTQFFIFNDDSIAAGDYVLAEGPAAIFVGSQGQAPPLPANVNFAVGTCALNPSACAPFPGVPFISCGYTQPISHGPNDIWIAAATGDAHGQNIYRTQVSGGVYSPWALYQTGPVTNVSSDPLPWTVVDASNYRGVRGDIFEVGQYFDVWEYHP